MHTSDASLQIRLCTMQDLDDIMKLQDRICTFLDQPELFVPTCREDNASYLVLPNRFFGVYDQDRLIAYASLIFPGTSTGNLGWDLEWEEEKVTRCATLDTIVVDPAYRGLGLQRTLIRRCIDYTLSVREDSILLTTVCPANKYSLRNVQSEGFQILKRLLKYGGRDPYILGYSQKNDLDVSTS